MTFHQLTVFEVVCDGADTHGCSVMLTDAVHGEPVWLTHPALDGSEDLGAEPGWALGRDEHLCPSCVAALVAGLQQTVGE